MAKAPEVANSITIDQGEKLVEKLPFLITQRKKQRKIIEMPLVKEATIIYLKALKRFEMATA